jgi:hypothetical protein
METSFKKRRSKNVHSIPAAAGTNLKHTGDVVGFHAFKFPYRTLTDAF